MAWTTPKTWAAEPLTSSDLNTYLRDNQEALKYPPSANHEFSEASNYTTTSTTFVDVDATSGKFSHTITTNGGDVMVGFMGSFLHSSSGVLTAIFLDINVDGSAVGSTTGFLVSTINASNVKKPMSFVYLITDLSAGSHTFKLQWKTGAATATLIAGASGYIHPQFWVREVS